MFHSRNRNNNYLLFCLFLKVYCTLKVQAYQQKYILMRYTKNVIFTPRKRYK